MQTKVEIRHFSASIHSVRSGQRESVVSNPVLPDWLPDAARLYLDHTEQGVSLRALARARGCHASTVMRQVRRYESRRDDPLVDEALAAIGTRFVLPPSRAAQDPKEHTMHQTGITPPEGLVMAPKGAGAAAVPPPVSLVEDAVIEAEAVRLLHHLAEPGAVLAIAADMERAAILQSGPDARMTQVAVLDRSVAQAFALKDWIACRTTGRVATYVLTPAGRHVQKRLSAQGRRGNRPGFAESAAPFSGPAVDAFADDGRKSRYSAPESPVAVLARRRDKGGQVFLEAGLVQAAERLREDFELAQIGPRVAQNWDRFLTGGAGGGPAADGTQDRGRTARDRVAAALRDLGPGLGDVALRCCCYQEGLEQAEQRLGWAARSGKVVLRIALQRLRRHYDEVYGTSGPMIG